LRRKNDGWPHWKGGSFHIGKGKRSDGKGGSRREPNVRDGRGKVVWSKGKLPLCYKGRERKSLITKPEGK